MNPAKYFAFTIAVGKSIYLEMAIALARSFLRWNADADIGFTLCTDRPISERPADLSAIDWIEIGTDQFGSGFTPKLYLDQLAPADQSLFIDADCLCVRSLIPIFEAFSGHTVSVIGRHIDSGEWFGDIARITGKLGVRSLPRFNGGVYYIERGEKASAIYETARELLPRYDELGFVRLRDKENDEVLIAASMAIHGEQPIPDDGAMMNTTMEAPGGVFIDVLDGVAIMRNPQAHPNHFDWCQLEEMRPAIVHFLGSNADEHPYRTEIEALKAVANGWSPVIARFYVSLVFAARSTAKSKLKAVFRPAYHAVFGVRPVKISKR